MLRIIKAEQNNLPVLPPVQGGRYVRQWMYMYKCVYTCVFVHQPVSGKPISFHARLTALNPSTVTCSDLSPNVPIRELYDSLLQTHTPCTSLITWEVNNDFVFARLPTRTQKGIFTTDQFDDKIIGATTES